jgi:hypothetical protein
VDYDEGLAGRGREFLYFYLHFGFMRGMLGVGQEVSEAMKMKSHF